MKRIVLLTDPHRVDAGLLQRLHWLFPECQVEILAVADVECSAAGSTSKARVAPASPQAP